MKDKMRVMSERPLNAETPVESLRSWITDNQVFFKRNQGKIMESPVDIDTWSLSVEGLVEKPLQLSFNDLLGMEKTEMANTLECSGNGRSLLTAKGFRQSMDHRWGRKRSLGRRHARDGSGNSGH